MTLRRGRAWLNWWYDGISTVAQIAVLGGSCLSLASLLAVDGPPWPFAILGLAIAGAGGFVAVARFREIMVEPSGPSHAADQSGTDEGGHVHLLE